jgi:hypothetical protein
MLDKCNNGTTQLRIMNARESFDQRKAVRCGEEVAHVAWGFRFRLRQFGQTRCARCAFEEERNGHLKDLAQPLQSARADAVGALLVFLHLLDRQTERDTDFGLAHIGIRRRILTRPPACLSIGLIWPLGIERRRSCETIQLYDAVVRRQSKLGGVARAPANSA